MCLVAGFVANRPSMERLLAIQNILADLLLTKTLEDNLDEPVWILPKVCDCHFKVFDERCLFQAVISRIVCDDDSLEVSTLPKGVHRKKAQNQHGDNRDGFSRSVHWAFSTLTGYPAAFIPEWTDAAGIGVTKFIRMFSVVFVPCTWNCCVKPKAVLVWALP